MELTRRISKMTIRQKLLNIQAELKAPKNQFKQGVYAILNPNDQIYIGSSTNIDRRFYQYRGLYETSQHKLYNSLNKYGVDSHNFFIVEYCDVSQLYMKERKWGDYFNCLDRYEGLNLCLPGYGDVKKTMSKETREKIGKAHRGKKLSKKQKEALMSSLVGVKQTEEHINKRKMFGKDNPAYGNTYRKGIKHTKATREKISKGKKGKYTLGDNPNAKKVIDNSDGKVYSSAKEVSQEFNINYSTLKAWLQGVNRGSGRFEYV